MNTKVVAFTLVLIALVAVGVSLSYSQMEKPAGAMKAGFVFVNNEQAPEGGNLMHAFVPTGSKSNKCLITINDATFAPSGTQVFCGARQSSTYGAGVLVTIIYTEPVPANYGLYFTVWQDGALLYGSPIYCVTAGVC